MSEGQEVEVKILSVDKDAQKMSLSIKAAQAAPAAEKAAKTEEAEEPLRESAVPKHRGPLKGGTNRGTGGDQFGLNW